MRTQGNVLLELKDVWKSFSGIPILKDIHLAIHVGEVRVILGENGAGKSTLIKLITGAHSMDAGRIVWKGQSIRMRAPGDAMNIGVACIYQELNLIPELTVYENIFLGREQKRKSSPFLDIVTMKKRATEYLKQLGVELSPDAKISALGMGQRQLVEIARALSMNAKLIIMDEPTSTLSEVEVENLLRIIKELKQQGIAILYISHKLEELKRIGDTISILRDGGVIGSYQMSEISTDRMIQLMVGRNLSERYPKTHAPVGKEGFRCEGVQLRGSPHKISFSAYQGQALGIAGLVGAGRTEFARGIFGVDELDSGSIYIYGEKVTIQCPRDALQSGLALIPENRKEEGLILNQSVEFNISLATLHNQFFIKRDELRERSERYVEELKIHPADTTKHADCLSGGNQQKVVISKWLATNAKIYIFDEPTRGIDAGAKVEVYHLLNALVKSGAIVIVISSELTEILGICDRVLVMREGKVTGDFLTKETDQEEIMRAATGRIKCKQLH